MHAKNNERMCGAVDQEAFDKVIRDNLSPEGVTTIIAFLQPAAFYRPANEQALAALRQVRIGLKPPYATLSPTRPRRPRLRRGARASRRWSAHWPIRLGVRHTAQTSRSRRHLLGNDPFGFSARKILPTLDDDVAVERV
jgi:hypothetical protein